MKRIDLFYITTIIFAVITAWHKVLYTTITGEGFYYFSPGNSFFINGKFANLIHGIDNFAKIATFFLEKLYAGGIQGYINFQFIIMIIATISFYVFVKAITKQPSIAFLTTIYSSLNYTANYQFYARGHFQWFLQRVPEMIPVLVSFYFLYKFIETEKLSKYIYSFFFYWLALFVSNYSTLFLSFFPAYLVVSSITSKKSISKKVKLVLLSIPFVFLTYIVTSSASLNLETIHPNQTFIQSLLSVDGMIPKISFQLASVTIPFSLLKLISAFTGQTYQNLIFSLSVSVYIFYFFIFAYLKKNRSTHFDLSLAFFLALLGNLFINIYLNRIKVTNEIEQGRYYFIPAIYVGIIFSTFIYTIINNFKTNKKIKFVIVIFLISIVWIATNINLIWKKMDDSRYFYTATKNVLNHLNQEKVNFPENSIVFVPSPPGSNSVDFLKKFYGGKNTTFLYLDENWRKKIENDIPVEKLFVYDIKEKIKVVDRTQEYRKMYLENTTQP